MKVIEYTPNRLILHDRSVLQYWRIGCLYTLGVTAFFAIIASPFTMIIPSFAWKFLTEEIMATLTCTRTQSSQDMCQLVRVRRIGKEIINIPVNDLQSATVITKTVFVKKKFQQKETSYSYYYVLFNKKWGSIRFTLHEFNNEDEQKSHASKINYFIHNQNENYLSIEQKFMQPNWTFIQVFWLMIFSLPGLAMVAFILTIMFLAMLYALRITTCTFDKTTGMMTLKHQALRKIFDSIVIQCSLEEIKDIQIKTFSGKGNSWKIELILEQSKAISLNWMETPDREEKLIAAECIRQFLNL
ncbi:hypothetical protein A6S26_20690 [Nostoc sp. ATCC 43529]|nr:hypothetical protein A6S26_20690 [Nostoc sp. ATCC 43529]